MNSGLPHFPTAQHQAVAELVLQFFEQHPRIDTVLAVNSCARGVATPESDLDFAILGKEGISPSEIADLEASWWAYAHRQAAYEAYRASGPWAFLHLDVIDGKFAPSVWDEGGGPDDFEVEVGNRLLYSAPMGKVGPHFRALQQRWLPYYEAELRQSRLEMIVSHAEMDLDHLVVYADRGLHFHAFDLLYKAHRTFLQALFVAHQTYPIAYNKWIRHQIVDILELPEVYETLQQVLSIQNFGSAELIAKAELLRGLLHAHCRQSR